MTGNKDACLLFTQSPVPFLCAGRSYEVGFMVVAFQLNHMTNTVEITVGIG